MYETLDALRDFSFAEVGELREGNLALTLTQRLPLNVFTGHVPAYDFNMRLDNTRDPVGRISLRVGNIPDVVMYLGHIGYGVDAEYRGLHLAARSCKLLFPLAKQHGLNPLWITCNPDNWASRRTCELIGGQLHEIVDVPNDNALYLRGETRKCRYLVQL
jgi:tagatose 1,6-diphosphate aldolase